MVLVLLPDNCIPDGKNFVPLKSRDTHLDGFNSKSISPAFKSTSFNTLVLASLEIVSLCLGEVLRRLNRFRFFLPTRL